MHTHTHTTLLRPDGLNTKDPQIRYVYSTPSKYLAAREQELASRLSKPLETYVGDFFPYEDMPFDNVWTG
jgi:hypothetical protein